MALRDEAGQATVELAIVFPIVIIIAVIAINALLFFGQCASFDRVFRQVVSTVASSPASGQNTANTKNLLERELYEAFTQSNIDFEVSVEANSGDFHRFSGKLLMQPTLFGMGLKREIFGVSLPSLTHECQMTIDEYKPGVMF